MVSRGESGAYIQGASRQRQILFPPAFHMEQCGFLREKGCQTGANRPTTPEGINIFMDNGLLYDPAKVDNAGGVSAHQVSI